MLLVEHFMKLLSRCENMKLRISSTNLKYAVHIGKLVQLPTFYFISKNVFKCVFFRFCFIASNEIVAADNHKLYLQNCKLYGTNLLTYVS